MSDIAVQDVFDVLQSSLALPAGSTRAGGLFLEAIRSAVTQINDEADLATQITLPTDTNDTLTGLDEKFRGIVIDGTIFYLSEYGQRMPKRIDITRTESRFKSGIDRIYTDILNSDQEDPENVDIIGLGHKVGIAADNAR